MAHCRSWRPREHAAHPEPRLPGECRRCWTPCRNRVAKGELRCETCTELILEHPNADIRKALADDPAADTLTLLALTEDASYSVVLAAENTLAEQERALELTNGPSVPATRDAAPRGRTTEEHSWLNE